MSLWTHLTAPDKAAGESKISKHAWPAAIREFARGASDMNADKIADKFGLTAGELVELNTWYTDTFLTGTADFRHALHDVWLLWSEGIYSNAETKARLGM